MDTQDDGYSRGAEDLVPGSDYGELQKHDTI